MNSVTRNVYLAGFLLLSGAIMLITGVSLYLSEDPEASGAQPTPSFNLRPKNMQIKLLCLTSLHRRHRSHEFGLHSNFSRDCLQLERLPILATARKLLRRVHGN